MTALCFLFAVTLSTTAEVKAQEDDGEYGRQGMYMELGFAYSLDILADPSLNGGSFKSKDSMGIDAKAGYRLNKYLAMDIEVLYNLGFEIKAEGIGSTGPIDDVWLFSLMNNAKWYPLAGRVQPYGIFGVGYSLAHIWGTTYTGKSLRFGAGIDIYATNSFVPFLEASYFLGETPDLEGFNFIPIIFGAKYRF